MDGNDDQSSVEVRISAAGVSARLLIPAGIDPALVTEEGLHIAARQVGIVLTAEVLECLGDAATSYAAQPDALDVVIAEAAEPVHGEDGKLVFEEGCDPGESTHLVAGADETGTVDHYNVKSFVMTTEGMRVAMMTVPTPGVDGQDVTGRVLAARPGQADPTEIDGASLDVQADGAVVALNAGVLRIEGGALRILHGLDIPGYVDFSTGNISFDGTVTIHDGVRDQFIVSATKDVNVGGLLEAATIICGGDLICRRGMAAKECGQVLVYGETRGTFFNNVRGWVKKDFHALREVMNCELIVGGDVHCENGSIIGGKVIASGAVHVGRLGSEAGVPTTLVLGTVPRLNRKLGKLARIVAETKAELKVDETILETLQCAARKLTAAEKERATEIVFELTQLSSRLDACELKREELRVELQHTRTVCVNIGWAIHPQVRLIAAGCSVLFDRCIDGPVYIGWDARKRLVYRHSDGPAHDLHEIAQIQRLAG